MQGQKKRLHFIQEQSAEHEHMEHKIFWWLLLQFDSDPCCFCYKELSMCIVTMYVWMLLNVPLYAP